MTERTPRFGALVVASLAAVVGAKYLIGGVLATVETAVSDAMLVTGSVPATFAAGLLLVVAAGGIVDGAGWARAATVLTFLLVAALSAPALLAFDPIIVTETVGMGLASAYLLVRNPIEDESPRRVDEEDSASRIGSTLR
ncbi:hypothetical protein [Haloarcula nitratireducens]|uniref:DoxX family protein n=1 Tax=Haloarcula nitratireducens TaxID=2487749 RepID=A0AAW4P7B1_9EURY|nr:hypothetical protein [Halomicroarcula nitratireducens]MBX0293746.1 hypothetical protein [Halomicroarcula nitratireducens]